MPEPLYRLEALNARFSALHGASLDLPPPGQRLLTMVFLVLTSAVLLLLVFGAYTARETVSGYVATTSANVQVFAQRDGVVVAVLVEDGSTVHAGDPLLRISVARTTPGSNTDADLVLSMTAEKAASDRLFERAGSLHESALASLRGQLANGQGEAGLLDRQIEIADQRLAILNRELRALQKAAVRGHVAAVEVEGRRLQVLDNTLARAELERRLAALRSDNEQLFRKQQDLPLLFEQELARLSIAREQINQRMANAVAGNELVVSAPIGGRVSGLQVRNGDTVGTARPLLSILPLDAQYYVELLVPDRAIGFVRSGDAVRLRIDAYPFQKFGTFHGVVTSVARTLAMPGDPRVPLAIREAVFLVKVRLAERSGEDPGEKLLLLAGMAVSADVLGERRRIIEWMLSPLIAAAGTLSG
ncbi:MAG: HlyD family efflux transporter periplasmic adaptor subunit [Halioglobus sp.]|nr:HlyD family efflux transporter periplasmic adaptor subunit [Halioglobus sp.]